jgi:Phytanoyl-CoA dioxygenase (PhyH)
MDQAVRQKLARQVFESTLSRAEVDSYLQHALDEAYWQRLSPGSSIGTTRSATELEAATLGEPQAVAQLAKLRREGYFHTPPVLALDVLRRMRQAIDNVRAEHWPAVFAYVYDDFWDIVRTPSLTRLVSGFLGDGYSQSSRIWAFYVAPARGARGWHPHCDSGDNDRLTVWVPLTDATLDNGCMYVVPLDRLAAERNYLRLESVTQAELATLLQSTKALPSPAGAYLGWKHDLIHWGSVSSGHVEPRISLALEFVAPGAVPHDDELPLFPLTTLPPFIVRLRAIAKALQTYTPYEPSNLKFGDLGLRLAETLS